jgi:hypothetical protein
MVETYLIPLKLKVQERVIGLSEHHANRNEKHKDAKGQPWKCKFFYPIMRLGRLPNE